MHLVSVFFYCIRYCCVAHKAETKKRQTVAALLVSWSKPRFFLCDIGWGCGMLLGEAPAGTAHGSQMVESACGGHQFSLGVEDPGEQQGQSLPYSCLEESMDRRSLAGL